MVRQSHIHCSIKTRYGQLLLVVCLLGLIFPLLQCHTINDTNRLLRDKLTDYNKNTRPTYDQSKPTNVTFSFELIYIQEFDEVQQKLSLMGVPTLHWIDESVAWNPADYGGMYTFAAESGHFWIPNLVLTNSVGEWKPISDNWQVIRFYTNGAAYYSPGKIYSSACTVDITNYPWDIHRCLLSFTPQGYGTNEVYLTLTGNKAATNYYLENGGWAFVDSKIAITYSTFYTDLEIELIFERKPRYVIVNVILPIIFMAFLSNVVFLIPADCGERISYSITVLLAIAVYLTLVGDNLPKTSNPMSYFSYYLLALLVTSICVSMATIFNLRIYHSDESEAVTGCWARIATCFKCSKKKRKLKEAKYEHPSSNGHVSEVSTRVNAYNNAAYLHARKIHVPLYNRKYFDIPDRSKMISAEKLSNETNDISWKDVSVALDKLFFLTFSVILIVASFIYVVLIATSERVQISE